jgi:two-component system OmpR family sensor kinase/two-component system sensor histidine kinase QseC
VATRERVIQVAQPVEIRQRLAAHAAWRSVLPLLLMTPFAALAIWWLAAQNLAPLDALAREVRSRDARSLAPVPTSGLPDEVAPLASALNALLERLRSSLDSQRAFVADAAHELRSPLTALKLQLRLLRQAGDDATRSAAIESVAAGIDRAARLIEQLLTLARSEPGRGAGAARAGRARRAGARGARGDARVRPRPRQRARPRRRPAGRRRRRAKRARGGGRNLVDNAIRYSPPGSRVDVGVGQEDGAAWLRVDDAGPASRRPSASASSTASIAAPARAKRAAASAWRSFAASPSGTARRSPSPTRPPAACARRCASRRPGAGALILASPNAH